jgi:PEP-CTERM motif
MRFQPLALASCAVMALSAVPASANPISLAVTKGTLQQIDNRPCVIGDPSCHNPSTLPYTVLRSNDRSDVVSSPVYTVDQIRSLVGDTFFVGVDLNQAMGHDGGAYMLNAFTLTANGVPMFSTSGPMSLTPLSPGNGYSDAFITGFDLTGMAGSTKLVFTTNFSGGTAGREQYFLRPGTPSSPTPSPTPEPGTLLLLGTGAVALLRRKARD